VSGGGARPRPRAAVPPAPAAAATGARATWRAAWPGLLLAATLLLPFLGKAHTIDDVTFLLQAQHALHDPWHPTAFEMVADGHRVRLSAKLVTGPLMAWLLVPCVRSGGAEWAAHLLQLLLVGVAIVSTVRIALRIGLERGPARLAGFLVASGPAVIGMATTSMSDVPAMAFAALGMERFLAWVDERRLHQGVAAAVALACAGLARSHVLALPFVALLALRRTPARAARGWSAALPLAASLALVAAVMLVTADPAAAHGTFLDAIRARGRVGSWRGNLAAFGVHWLAAVPLALPWLWARGRHVVRDVAAWLVFAAAGAFMLWGVSPAMPEPLAIAAALAFVALWDVARDAWRRDDRIQVLLGAWLLPALVALVYVHLPCKFLLVSVPAAALLTARLLDRPDARLPAAVAAAVVIAGATLGVLIALADGEFAEAGRQAAREFVAPNVEAGQRVRYYGAWGGEWYALQAGATVDALEDAAPSPGDVLVVSSVSPGTYPRRHDDLDPLGELGVTSHFGQVLSPNDGVGFYSNAYGYLPWTWRNGEVERVTVWRVRGGERAPSPAQH